MKYILVLVAVPLLTLLTFAAPGDFDTTFDTDGKVLTSVAGLSLTGNAVAVQADGKVVVTGYSEAGFTLIRYNVDGSLDISFDSDGVVTTAIGAPYSDETATAIVIQPDGRIIVAGYAYNSASDFQDFALVRYHADGSLDTTFDGDGKVVTDLTTRDDRAGAVALQSDGKIVVAGFAGSDFGVVRYNVDGSRDSGFGTSGIFTLDVSGVSVDTATSVNVQTDGKIVVGGYKRTGSNNDFAVARILADGSDVDATFGTSGIVITSLGANDDQLFGGQLQTDGKIVVAGTTSLDIALARYNTDGTLDTSFDADGIVITDIPAHSSFARALRIESDGKIVAAGRRTNGSDANFVICRYLPNGTLDNLFDQDGMITVDFGAINDQANAVALAPDGKIVVAGFSNNQFAVARFLISGGFTFNAAVLAAASASNQIVIFPGGVLPMLTQIFVTGLLSPTTPHGVAVSGPDEVLVADFNHSRIYVTKVSTNSTTAVIDTSAAGYTGAGTIAVSPDHSTALASGITARLYKIEAPFNASSTITSIPLPSEIKSFQTQAIVFDNAGRAFVYHVAGISVLDPPYTSIAFTIPIGNAQGGAIAITPDGSKLLATNNATFARIVTAPFSGASTAVDLFLGISGADGIAVSPDGTKAIVADSDFRRVLAVNAPFTGSSTVVEIPLPSNGSIEGFEDVGISPDGKLAIVTGQSSVAPPVFIRAPFGTTSQTYDVPINQSNSSRGAGAVRFMPLTPTAAHVSISGRVTDEDGRGLASVRLRLSDPSGATRATITNSFGYFRFENVEVGHSYLIDSSHKAYTFDQRTVQVLDEIADMIMRPANAKPGSMIRRR